MNIIIFFLVIIIDQLTKYLALNTESIMVVRNTGISFGLGSHLSDLLLIVLTSITIIFLTKVMYDNKNTIIGIGFTFIIAGGIGNLIDRILRSHVVDFISFPSFWPTYNIADVAISIGVVVIVFFLLIDNKSVK